MLRVITQPIRVGLKGAERCEGEHSEPSNRVNGERSDPVKGESGDCSTAGTTDGSDEERTESDESSARGLSGRSCETSQPQIQQAGSNDLTAPARTGEYARQ